jgi:hypothetical protein
LVCVIYTARLRPRGNTYSLLSHDAARYWLAQRGTGTLDKLNCCFLSVLPIVSTIISTYFSNIQLLRFAPCICPPVHDDIRRMQKYLPTKHGTSGTADATYHTTLGHLLITCTNSKLLQFIHPHYSTKQTKMHVGHRTHPGASLLNNRDREDSKQRGFYRYQYSGLT